MNDNDAAAIRQDGVDSVDADNAFEDGAERQLSSMEDRLSARDEMIARIAARNEQSLAEREGRDPVMPDEVLDDGDMAKTDRDADIPDAAASQRPDSREKRTYKVKVLGQESEVDEDALIAGFQKAQAAERRLQEAAEATRRVAQKEAELREREAALNAIQQAKQQATSDVEVAELDDLAQELMDSVFEEDKEGVKRAIKKVAALSRAQNIPQQQTRQVSQEDIDRGVEEALRRKEANKAIARFREEYRELANDPDGWRLVNEQSKVEMMQNPGADIWTIIDSSARAVKQKLAGLAGVPGDGRPEESLRDRKRNAGPAIRPSIGKRAPGRVLPRELSPFEQIKLARGQS
jgi:hypothetical protein